MASDPLIVEITPNTPPFVDPFNLRVPWHFDGEIWFEILDADETFVPPKGIVFQEGAPYTFVRLEPKKVVYSAHNDNANLTGIRFSYTIELESGPLHFPGEDPTVENDPPGGGPPED